MSERAGLGAMGRLSKVALFISAVVLMCTLGVCAVGVALGPQLASVAGCDPDPGPDVSGVREDQERIQEILPILGEVSSVHWRWREARPRTCPDLGPMDYVYEGFAALAARKAAALRTEYAFEPTAAPDVPADLAPHGPSAALWRRSAALDAVAHASLWLDEPTGTVYFSYLRG